MNQYATIVELLEHKNTVMEFHGNDVFYVDNSQKVCKILKFLARRRSEDMPIILSGDFNVNVRDNYIAELVEFMKDNLRT
jgi:endonuclease/exonuclease/phosphatase (EEP) superfamily protein YafD